MRSEKHRSRSLYAALLALAAASSALAQPPAAGAWPGSQTGPAALSLTEATHKLTLSIIAAIEIVVGATKSPPKTEPNTIVDDSKTGGWDEVGKTTVAITGVVTGDRMSGDVRTAGTDTYANPSDSAQGGRVLSTGNGHFEVAACPNPSGVAEGHISIALQHATTLASGASDGGTSAYDASFQLIDGDDARILRTILDAQFTIGAQRTPAGGGDSNRIHWALSGPLSVVLSRGETTTRPVDVTRLKVDPTSDHVPDSERISAVESEPAQFILLTALDRIGMKAEEYWRGGNCIELKPSEKSRDVGPDEKIALTVNAIHKFDKQEVRAPIEARFSGKSSLEPNRVRLDPPATFDFVAGHDVNDVGTIRLEQIGKRGIGKDTVEFKVKPLDLLLSFALALRQKGEDINGSVSAASPQITLRLANDGAYHGSGSVMFRGRWGVEGCFADLDFTAAIQVVALGDEADKTLFRLGVIPDPATKTSVFTCPDVGLSVPVQNSLVTWLNPVANTAAVLGQSVPVRAELQIDDFRADVNGSLKLERPPPPVR